MKRKILPIVSGLLLTTLTACAGKKDSLAHSCWEQAKKSNDFHQYAAENASKIDMEALKKEADAADNDLELQFQAVTLLCALEFQNSLSEDIPQKEYSDADMYQFDYPASKTYAEQFLTKAADGSDGFWEALETAFYPYDCFTPLFAAAEQLDGTVLAQLRSNVPNDCGYKDEFLSDIDQWVEENPEDLAAIADALEQEDYFRNWDASLWKQTYFHSYLEDNHIQTATAQEALSYVSYLRSSILPALKKEFGKEEFQQSSEVDGKAYYATDLMVTVEEDLQLAGQGKKEKSGKIDITGKKVAAFYQNPYVEEWEGSPARLRLLGDFMLGLSKKEYPSSLAEADYYLILTPEYKHGEFYQDQSGNESKVQEVYSSTSIDLYNAKNGKFLRHLGNVTEESVYSVYRGLSEETLQYPQVVSADILSCIYHNLNHPDSYATLLDNTVGVEGELQHGESILLGNWELAYMGSQIVKSFDEGILRYTAKDGCQFVRARLKVTNRGAEQDTFLPLVYQTGKDVVVQITDGAGENVYDCVDAVSDSECLNSTILEQGGSKEGELIFEVPDKILQKKNPLYVAVSLGKQRVVYLLD